MRTGEHIPIPVVSVTLDMREAFDALRRFEANLGDMKPGLLKVGARARQMQLDHVDGGVDENYKPWPPLAPITIALKGSSKPLVDKGQMRTSIKAHDATANSVEVGITGQKAVEKAHTQNYGSGGSIRVKTKRVLARELTKAKVNKVLKTAQEQRLGGIRISRNKKTGKEYAIFGRMVRIPPRQFFFINQREAAELTGILADHIVYGGLQGGAFKSL